MSFTEVENILKEKLIEIIQQNGVLIPLITSSTLILMAVFSLFANVINAYFLIIKKLFRSVLKINNQIFGAEKKASVQINLKIKKDQPKVVDAVNCGEIENLAEFKDGKLVMCRCWKSSTYPYCDGSHVKHNKETGDNVGPLIIKK